MKLGTNDISSVYLGTNAVQKVYLGTNEVWSSGPAPFATTQWQLITQQWQLITTTWN